MKSSYSSILGACLGLVMIFSLAVSNVSGQDDFGGADKSWEDNLVYVDLVSKISPDVPADTILVGVEYAFRVHIANAWLLGGMSLGFEITTEDGATWSWVAQPEGYPEDGSQAVTVIEGSRLGYPDGWALDMTKLVVTEADIDGISPDTIMVGGVAMMYGIEPGPLQPMFNMHFRVDDMAAEAGFLCIDSAFVPPSGLFCFVDIFSYIQPEFNGPFCWPVGHVMVGDFDLDGQVTVGDAVEMIKVIFLGKEQFAPVEAGDVNCDGLFNVGDVIYLIAYIFKFGPSLGCP